MDNSQVAQVTHHAMGTVMTHKALGLYAEDSLSAVYSEIARIEALLSRFSPDSEISRVNLSAGIKSESVSPRTYDVLSEAIVFSRRFPGCFDLTITPLVALWSKARASSAQPDAASIEQVLPLVNYRDVLLDSGAMTAGLRTSGQSIDLGGIGKGFAGDRIREVYKCFDIASAYSNLGGNVVTLGAKPDGSPWYVGIQHPRAETGLIGAVAVVDQTVVTSGDYQRYFVDKQGKRHHHILDPKTGYPAESGLISVTIVSENALAADALSTIVFVAGMEKGLGYLRSFPRTEAILVDSGLQVYVTRGLEGRFQVERGIAVTILD